MTLSLGPIVGFGVKLSGTLSFIWKIDTNKPDL